MDIPISVSPNGKLIRTVEKFVRASEPSIKASEKLVRANGKLIRASETSIDIVKPFISFESMLFQTHTGGVICPIEEKPRTVGCRTLGI
jgi:hypothetical protein